MVADLTGGDGELHLRDGLEEREQVLIVLLLLHLLGAGVRQVVRPEHDILAGGADGLTGSRGEDVVGCQHEQASLQLGLDTQRDVHGHLVTVEVGVVTGTHERMQTDGVTLDEHGLEGLNGETVQRWGTVQEDGVTLGHLLQDVPHHGLLAVDHLLGRAHGVHQPTLLEVVDDEGLKQVQGHLLRQTALVHLEVRTDHDDGTTGVVHALAEQVLAETAALALQHIGERLERAVAGPRDVATVASVVKQGVHSLLQHAALIALDNLRRLQSCQLAQAVVAVDDAAVEVVQVAGGEAATGQGNERAQIRRDDRQHGEHHPLRLALAVQEALGQLQTLGNLALVLLRAGLGHVLAQAVHQGLKVEVVQQLLNGHGTHLCLRSLITVVLLQLVVLFFREDLVDGVTRQALGVDDDEVLVVNNTLQVMRGQIQHETDAAGHALIEPDVSHGHGQLDVAHALATHAGGGDFHTAAVADCPLVLGTLVAAAGALHVTRRAEDALAEETALLRLERAVVNRLRVLHLAVGPGADVLRACDGDADLVEVLGLLVVEVNISHMGDLLKVWLIYSLESSSSSWKSISSSSLKSTSLSLVSSSSSPAASKSKSSSVVLGAFSRSLRSMGCTLRQRACISLMSTLKDSGVPASRELSPFTMFS